MDIHSPFGRCFVSNILQRAQLGMPLKVVNDQYGNPTYAPHLVDVILEVAAYLHQDRRKTYLGAFSTLPVLEQRLGTTLLKRFLSNPSR